MSSKDDPSGPADKTVIRAPRPKQKPLAAPERSGPGGARPNPSPAREATVFDPGGGRQMPTSWSSGTVLFQGPTPGAEADSTSGLPQDALVLALPGGGHVADTVPAILEAMPMPVIFASRTGAGETLTHSYGYAGGEIDLIARGLIPAGPLDARHARIALAILLSNGATKKDIAAFFGGL